MDINVNIKDVKLGVIGCGKMASAILGGVVKNNFINPDKVFVFDINEKSSNFLSEKYGFNFIDSIDNLLKCSNVILLAIKPFAVNDVLLEIQKRYTNQLIISILAGVKLEKYTNYLPKASVVRVMPNTPALVNLGMSAICKSEKTSSAEEKFVYDFMKNCGEVIVTTEDKMDIITALSGSGPAFYFRIIDLMAKSAQKLGLDYKQALILSAQTALGSAKMIFENEFDIEKLISNVTTPGGCTEVGNLVLNSSNIDDILDKTIKDTMDKAIKLG